MKALFEHARITKVTSPPTRSMTEASREIFAARSHFSSVVRHMIGGLRTILSNALFAADLEEKVSRVCDLLMVR